jgi:hypothetical protein
MATYHNRRFAVAQRRLKITEFYLKGWSQSAIAVELNVSQSTVSKDLRHVHRHWEESAVRNYDKLKMREIQTVDYLQREGFAAWERSQKPSQSATMTGEGNGQQTRKSVKNQVGDPRFLDLVSKCIAHRRAIMGLDAPLQMADVTPAPPEEPIEKRRARLAEISRAITGALDQGSDSRRRTSTDSNGHS